MINEVSAPGLAARPYFNRYGRELSGGQRHRLALARALLTDAPILLCDEPDASLDRAMADQIIGDLLRAADDRAVILVTHRPERLAQVDETITIHDGRVAERDLTPVVR